MELNNLRVLKSIRHDLGADDAKQTAWTARWIGAGFEALESLVARHGGREAAFELGLHRVWARPLGRRGGCGNHTR